MITLRKKIEESKAWYLQRYGVLDWQWEDEGLPYAIMDYHSSVGSTLDFSEDDWKACEENGWSKYEVLILCDEKYILAVGLFFPRSSGRCNRKTNSPTTYNQNT